MDDWTDWQHVLDSADIDTARLIVQLQLEDVGAIAPSRTFSNSRLRRPDGEVAAKTFEKELRKCEADLPDRKLGEDLEDYENDMQEALEAAAFGWKFKQWEGRHGKVEAVPEPIKLITCTSCADDFHPDKIINIPCGHEYCHGCLEHLYNSSMTDETLFPPRCCQTEFPWDLVKHGLSHRLKSKFGQKRVELETKDRTYCSKPQCSAFIDPTTIYPWGDAKCPKCGWYTCSKCKNGVHTGPCPRDEAIDVLMETAKNNEWQKCFGCRRVIELKTGCNHITCVCKSEFCYLCGEKWKTCPCAQWDEDRLIERAENIVDGGRAPVQMQQQGREAQIAEVAQHLRDHHECEHERFRGIREVGREYHCEMCGADYMNWIYQCRQCWMIACNRCRHNRI